MARALTTTSLSAGQEAYLVRDGARRTPLLADRLGELLVAALEHAL
jgi:hypothetical protein